MSFLNDSKTRMGYLSAANRPRCGNCHHAQESAQTGAPNDQWRWRCIKGGFGTSVNAVCIQHQKISLDAVGDRMVRPTPKASP